MDRSTKRVPLPEIPIHKDSTVCQRLGTQESWEENGLPTKIVASNAANQADETKPGGQDGVPAIPRTQKRAPRTLDHGSTTALFTPRVLTDVMNGAILGESLDDSNVLELCPPEHQKSDPTLKMNATSLSATSRTGSFKIHAPTRVDSITHAHSRISLHEPTIPSRNVRHLHKSIVPNPARTRCGTTSTLPRTRHWSMRARSRVEMTWLRKCRTQLCQTLVLLR